ncbi:MAG: T9SS type A sorting domain-containing protein, partial [Prevotella sp.]|nr:T9SS type A sorting domain-containing protein [Prevotella sp.]
QGMMGFPYPFIFPILTPPDSTHLNPVDTTHVDTTVVDTTIVDTVGIAQRMLERYTGLQPNPAAERVQVLSSFGLTGVEVYNAAGIKVQEQKATGYVATLDVGALPAGPYLVRIKTPNGTATKKLLVQRR